MKLNEFLLETFFRGFMSKRSRLYCEIYKNPTTEELRKILAEGKKSNSGISLDDMSFRGFLTEKDLYIWLNYTSLHFEVAEELHLDPRGETIGLYITWIPGYLNDLYLTVGHWGNVGIWHHNPEIKYHILNHRAWWVSPDDINLHYFDEAIVGPWDEIEEEL